MSIQSISGSPSSYQSPAALENTRQTLVLKKANEAAQVEAQALIQLVKGAAVNPASMGINVYA